MKERDLVKIRDDLQSPDKGYFLIRNFYGQDEVQHYLSYCQTFLENGPVIHDRINSDTIKDYVHPRSHDQVNRTTRIYQYLHNHQNSSVSSFLKKALDFRESIEQQWLSDDVYKSEKEKLQDYVIVTSYHGNHGMLPRHRDYSGPTTLPLIQFWVLLTEPEVDYKNGNIIIHTDNGESIYLERDFNLKSGDAVIFNKRLEHEVEPTREAGEGAQGRWTVLIGARAERDTASQVLYKKVRHSNLAHRLASWIKR
ncbi:hypothetical protein RS130_22900 [Paraglaciecola aquimarina]|uniref:Fe2OG dioxygenase domain-containing protein n=1 Tax=Paraglaciecola aquimarina TaxID=1235557 RepID=A0ABU3T266_9ALTE|nr:hypothetical protein [Paraglaciecola aquimarina]MDU0356359.1 hypothetical protein [Paraglaciecola aquimarina]